MAAWQQGSANALGLVERLAEESEADEKGEVWRVRLPVVLGHTKAGERPAIIVQVDRSALSTSTKAPSVGIAWRICDWFYGKDWPRTGACLHWVQEQNIGHFAAIQYK